MLRDPAVPFPVDPPARGRLLICRAHGLAEVDAAAKPAELADAAEQKL